MKVGTEKSVQQPEKEWYNFRTETLRGFKGRGYDLSGEQVTCMC